MKKILVLAAALVALASCTKNEVVVNSTNDMTFGPSALATKALIIPDGTAGTLQNFPTTETFSVFAFADIDDGAGYNYATPLMNDVEIAFHSTTSGGDWKAAQGTYVWPAAGTVDFYAYYPSSLTANFNSTTNFKHLELTNIELGTAVGGQIDPMLACAMVQNSVNRPKVGLVFKHITSQIAVTAFDATETTSLQGKISLKKVVFKNMKTSGDYAEGTTTGKGDWTNINNKVDFISFQGSEVLDTEESYLSAGSFSASIDNSAAFVVIPEDVVSANETYPQAIEITYSVAPYSINGFDYPAINNATETVLLYNRVSGNRLQNGKRYIFHLGLSLDGANHEIMFSPQVDGWATEDINGITIDVVNGGLI